MDYYCHYLLPFFWDGGFCYVAQTDPTLLDSSDSAASASQVAGLKACATIPGSLCYFYPLIIEMGEGASWGLYYPEGASQQADSLSVRS